MLDEVPEILIRQKTKDVLSCLQKEEVDKARDIILNYKEVLLYNPGLANFVPLIPRVRFSKLIPKNLNALKMIIEAGYKIFLDENDTDELLFFAAAKCDVQKLNFCISKIMQENPDKINQIRAGDNALMFVIKYGNLADESYCECIKSLINAGIDVSRNDYFSHNPILFLANLYDSHKDRAPENDIALKNLKKTIELLLDTKQIDIASIKTDEKETMTLKDFLKQLEFDGLDYDLENNCEEERVVKLFKHLTNSDEEGFKVTQGSKNSLILDADDGNNTLLQLCCEKNLKVAAGFLISNGADLCRTTERNPKQPIEIAARRNHQEIFDALLKTNRVVIDEQLFLTFLRNRPKHIKAKYFDEILKYKQLDVNIKSNNGNTPLHYAIIFSSTEAIGVLLQRGASLTVENDSKKCPLDYISAEDLEAHFNKCIISDSYNHIDNGKYEVALNFRNLVEVNDSKIESELVTIEKICNSDKLRHLVNHPLISSFIDIKWKLSESFYNKFFIFQLLFYLATILSYINLNLVNSFFSVVLALIYSFRIFLFFNWKNNKIHECVDIMISVIIILSTFFGNTTTKYQFGFLATIFMAISFHLFCRFSPKFSDFHAILINVISHILSYMFYVGVLMLFFGAACYIFFLPQYDNEIPFDHVHFFTDMKLSHFLAAFMITVFTLTIISSYIYLQQNFFENIKNNFKILGHENVLIFLKYVENFHAQWKMTSSFFIFEETNSKSEDGKVEAQKDKKKVKKERKSKNRFLVNFLVNRNKFSCERLICLKLDDANVSKIKKFVSK